MSKHSAVTRARTVLTIRTLEALKPETKAYRLPDARCLGLAARCAPSGIITFDLAFRIAGSKAYRRLSLGQFPDVSLDAARDRAGELTRAARAGRDLLAQEAQTTTTAAARITVGQLAEEYLARRVRGRLRTAREIEYRIKRTIAPIADRFADDLRRRDFRELLDVTADAGLLREVDQRRVCLNGLFQWALGQDRITSNPMIGLQSYDRTAPRSRVLSPDEIRTFWAWLDGGALREDEADVLRVQLALGARVSEVGGMCAEEFDTTAWLWTLPVARSKNKKPRISPLIGLAREIIEKRIANRGQGPLFTTATSIPINAMHMCITLRTTPPPIPKMVTHDLRRTTATQMVEALGIGLDTVARILGHVAGGAATRILTTHYINAEFIEQKRASLIAWDARLRAIIVGEIAPAANVVALAARKANG